MVGRETADLILEGEVTYVSREVLRSDRFGEAAEVRLLIKARVSVSYRDPYLIQVAPAATNNNDVRIKEKTTNVDTQISYAFDKFTVTFEGINLTDQADSKLDDSTRMISEEYVHFGRQYYLGVKYKF